MHSLHAEQSYPSFPSDIHVAQLTRVSLSKLQGNNKGEHELLLTSCRTSGFFFLDLRGAPEGEELLQVKENMLALGATLLNQKEEEKMKHTLGEGTTHGYKPLGLTKIDSAGTPDRCEFWSISVDSIISNLPSHPVPAAITQYDTVLKAYVSQAHSVCSTILTSLEKSLHLSATRLTSLHRPNHRSGSQTVILRMPRQPSSDRRVSLRAHTDAGTITLLFNTLGGLQVLRPGYPSGDENAWEYVRPESGCAIINLGDAMVEFTNGFLRSGLHRVTVPPGEQAGHERWSLLYGMRPESEVRMESVGGGLLPKDGSEKVGCTAKEWIAKKMVGMKNGGEAESIGGSRGEKRL